MPREKKRKLLVGPKNDPKMRLQFFFGSFLGHNLELFLEEIETISYVAFLAIQSMVISPNI